MANRYWVTGGTGAVNNSSNWSTTSGGSSGASVPGNGDDAFWDANSGSGTVTISSGFNTHSADFTGFTGTLVCSGSRVWTIGGVTTDTSAAVLTLGSGMTFTGGGTLNIVIDNRSGGFTLTSNGITMNGVTEVRTGTNASTVGITFADSANFGTAVYEINRGTHTLGANTLTCGRVDFLTSGNKTMSYNGGTINCTGWNLAGTTANATITGNGSSTLNVSSSGASFVGGSKTYPGTVAISGGGSQTMDGGSSFSTLTITGSATKTSNLTFSGNNTVTSAFTVSGNSAVNRLQLISNFFGAARTLTLTGASITATNVDFRDITSSGATITGTSIGDLGGNSGITTTGAVTRYWVGGTGNWSDTAHWSTSSGGSTGASMPLAQDSVIIDTNSFSGNGQTITIDEPVIPAISTSASTTHTHIINPTEAIVNSTYFYGNVTLAAQTTLLATLLVSWTMAKRGSMTWTSNGATLTPAFTDFAVSTYNQTLTVTDAFVHSGRISVFGNGSGGAGASTKVIFQDNVTCTTMYALEGVIELTSGKTVTLTSTSVLITSDNANGQFIFNGANIAVTDTSASSKTVTFGNTFSGTAGTLTITTGGAGIVSIGTQLAWGAMAVTGGGTKTIEFNNGSTYTLSNNTFFQGAVSNLITIRSTSAGSAFTLSCASTISTDYISLKDSTASGATPFYAGANSTNVSGNTNWTFSAPPGGSPVVKTLAAMGVG